MARVAERTRRGPAAITAPVDSHDRALGAIDLTILWGDLGIGLLVLVTGALLVPGLGLPEAIGAIVLGSVVGSALLAVAGAIGAREGVPAMVLFRPILGRRGSWVPSLLNAAQLIGWTSVELWAMSSVADLAASRTLGFSARPLWLAVTAVLTVVLALWGPVGVARVWMKRFGAWVITAICVALSVLLATSGALSEALRAPATGGWPTFGPALDLVIAMPVSWLPLVADYTRFARHPRAALVGTFSGYLVANVWLYTLGAALVTGAGAAPTPTGVAAAIVALGGGSLAGLLFLVGLLVGETDEAFADLYSSALSLRNVFARLPQAPAVIAIVAASIPLAAWLSMARYEAFLLLLGSVFVPLYGVLIGAFVGGRKVLGWDAHRSVRGALFAWAVGFVVYHWISPLGPSWWLDLSGAVLGSPLVERFAWLPASLPSFVLSLLLMLIARRVSSRQPVERGDR